MATYFHGSNEIQPESMQTLYLMNPNFTSYPNAQANLIQLPYPQAQAQAQYLVGIPVQSNNGLSLSLPMAEITAQVSVVRNESANISGLQSVLSNSKYLKFAQQLLDEVVSVGKGSREGSIKSNGDGNQLDRGHENEKGSVELSISERQELLMKKAKLVSMLDEVIQRYKQYHQQMQLVVSSFEAAAGLGSAKSYTALALQTMSKQFRSLRDAITGKIRTTAKSLGEEDFSERGSNSKGSRLQFVDQQVRQQRALQQLGMIHNNAWRPQRGLPERSVSVLRAWLFEHFLHPYPKDSDKKMLAKQAGLTRSQVSNWFINARVRLWKPMVEEMYKEEMKEHEQINADERTSETEVNKDSSLKSNAHQVNNPPPPTISIPPSSMEVHNKDDDMFIQSTLKKALSEAPMNRDDHESNGKYHERGGFVEYSNHIGEIERFGLEQFASRLSGNSISLTLGLTHYDGLSLSGSQPAFLSNSSIPFGSTVEISSENNAFSNLNSSLSVAHPSSNAYESITTETRKRFESQMLPQLY